MARRRRRRKPAIAGRRQFITGGGVAVVLGLLNNGLGVVDQLLSWRRVPGVVVETVATAAGRSVCIALSGVEAVTGVGSVSVVIAPSTGQSQMV